jgi:beta-1,4-galactosyltransferase 1
MLSIIVPYRNREEHLKTFISEIPKKIVGIDFNIVIVEQFDEKLFNRAKLLNVGFDYKKNTSDYFCFHDVDMIPMNVDYTYPDKPYHMATNVGQFGGSVAYPTYYGGVNLFNKEDFIKINGYSNDFWGWGGEDDDLLNRIKKNGFDLYRRTGHYISLRHIPNGPNHSNYQNNVKKLSEEYEYENDGLNTLKYELVSVEKINEITELIKVKL